MRPLLLVAALLMGAPAQAQSFFRLDAVFVSRFLAEPDTLDLEAQELHRMLEKQLASSFLVAPLDKVPPFDDYSAAVYLENCPEAQYNECSYVIASRAKADWAITARYTSDNPFNDFADRDVEVSIIDVESSRAVITFGATVASGNEETFAEGVANVLTNILDGDNSQTDIRENITDARADWEAKRAAAAAAAAELGDSDDIDLIVRGMSFDDDLKKERIKVEDLSGYDDRDDKAPWEQINMSREEFVRYKNSGHSLSKWRGLGNGRARQVMVRVYGGGGTGPYHHEFDGRWALAAENLALSEVEVYTDVVNGSIATGGIEVGFGILPILDVVVGWQARTGSYSWFFHQEVVGEAEPLGGIETQPWYTPALNAKVTVSPLPHSPLRPSIHAGFTAWQGSSIYEVVGVKEDGTTNLPAALQQESFGQFPTPQFFYLDVGGGIEARTGKVLDFFARANLAIRLSGETSSHFQQGPEVIFARAESERENARIGIEAHVGVQLRLPVFGSPKVDDSYDPLMSDEPDF